ncbi:hypothetical protein Aperf_G00000125753 [Anoplocephala perfoliata]
MSDDIEAALISGATLGFLSAAAYSENFYMQGLLLGRNAANSPRCLEIVAALPFELKPNNFKDFQPDSELRVVGIYKCKRCVDANRKFSVNDYRIMSKGFVELFFLVEAHDDLSTSQKLFQIRPRLTGDKEAKFVRQIGFTVMSIDSSIGKLYDVQKMLIGDSIDELARKTCSELENHATRKLSVSVNNLLHTMSNVYVNSTLPNFAENLPKKESLIQNYAYGYDRNLNGRSIDGPEPDLINFGSPSREDDGGHGCSTYRNDSGRQFLQIYSHDSGRQEGQQHSYNETRQGVSPHRSGGKYKLPEGF